MNWRNDAVRHALWLVLAAMLACPLSVAASAEPDEHVYARRGDQDLKIYVFAPDRTTKPRPAVLVFHAV